MITIAKETTNLEKWAFIHPGVSRHMSEYYEGILDFIKDHPNIILDSFTHGEKNISRFADINGFITYGIPPEGLISKVNALNRRQTPAIAITLRDVAPENFARAYMDPSKIAEAVVEKLRQRHCRSYGFCSSHTPFLGEETARLLQAYRQAVRRQTGQSVRLFKTVVTSDMNQISDETKRFVEWFKDIPRPCGMFVRGDDIAWRMINTCSLHDIEVPREIRIISTDNSSLFCDRTVPTLSSYAVNHEWVGFAAARALYAMIHAGTPPQESSFAVPLPGIFERASTQDVNGAGRIVDLVRLRIREAIDHGYAPTIRDLAHHFNVSRTKLQEDFRRTVGHTLHDEVAAYRLEKLATMLKASCEPAKLLLPRVGFISVSQAKRAFRARFGMTMTDFRRQQGAQAEGHMQIQNGMKTTP